MTRYIDLYDKVAQLREQALRETPAGWTLFELVCLCEELVEIVIKLDEDYERRHGPDYN